MARQMYLPERDRIRHLFDYGDEWRFYAIREEIDVAGSRDTEPTVVAEQGEPVEQYASSRDGR